MIGGYNFAGRAVRLKGQFFGSDVVYSTWLMDNSEVCRSFIA